MVMLLVMVRMLMVVPARSVAPHLNSASILSPVVRPLHLAVALAVGTFLLSVSRVCGGAVGCPHGGDGLSNLSHLRLAGESSELGGEGL